MSDTIQQVSSAQSVLQTSTEVLRELARKTDHIQDIIGQVISGGGCATDAHIRELQSLDHITQSIDAMADFLGALQQDTSEAWVYPHLNATKSVKLEALAARLAGMELPSTDADDDDGDLDLF